MKKKVFTALQVLGNAAGIVSGAVAMQYSSEIKGMGTGSGASYETYGGDAYTGIQNASAQVSHNVCDLSEIVRDSFSLLLFVIGLALICWSISSKVILLAKIWHADFPLANRIPIIPVLTALACLFLAAFLYEEAAFQAKFFVPARVLSGFGAICFTLYSIVSILESGTSKK